tara:strand:+ start:455 stop:718 length:264 start_codon:yes stop_codon:yes gene_type:complete
MNKKGLSLLASAILLSATPVNAKDVADGTILAFDRKARILVFVDKTVWPLEKMSTQLSDNLKAGDRVQVIYDADEEGVDKIYSIEKL